MLRPARNVEVTAATTYQTLHNQTVRELGDFAIPVPKFMAKVGVSYRTVSGLTLGVHDSYFGTPREGSHVDSEDPASTTQHVSPTANSFHNVTVNVAYRLPKLAFLRTDGVLTPHLYVSNLLGERIYYAEYTSVNVNSIPGRPGRAVFAGLSIGF